jgi:hypothetical protein
MTPPTFTVCNVVGGGHFPLTAVPARFMTRFEHSQMTGRYDISGCGTSEMAVLLFSVCFLVSSLAIEVDNFVFYL